MRGDDSQRFDAFGRGAQRRTMRGFTITLVVSFLLHGAGVGAAMYVGRQRPAPRLDNAIPVQLVKLGKKRDPKLLPRKVQEAQPPPPPDEGIKLDTGDKAKPPEPKEKTKKPPQAKEPELSDAAKRMLDQSKIDEALKRIEDPEGDPSGSEYGTTTDPTNAAAGYQLEIGQVLQANYRLPQAIPASQRQFLRASVVLFIERNGRIARYEFVERHPNTLFMGALEQLLSSITLPPPPKDLASQVKEGGIEVIFRP